MAGQDSPQSSQISSLPSYLSRHVNLGFNEDDISALLDSIEAIGSSQISDDDDECTPLPHIPAELILQILLEVPPTHILPLRLVSRSFRNIIDTYVFYSYLLRMRLQFVCNGNGEVIGFVKSSHNVEAVFHSMILEPVPPENTEEDRGPAKWDGTFVKFWLDPKDNREEQVRNDLRQMDWVHTLFNEQPGATPIGAVFTRLDSIVLDVYLPDVTFDMVNYAIIFNWRKMLFGLLKEERAIRLLLEHTADWEYHFSHLEDCLRHIRRQRLKKSLDRSKKSHRLVEWTINNSLARLFSHKRYFDYATSEDGELIDCGEHYTCPKLTLMRREAELSSSDRKYRDELLEKRAAMEKQERDLTDIFFQWRKRAFSTDIRSSEMRSRDAKVSYLQWTDDERENEAKRLKTFETQVEVADQLKKLLQPELDWFATKDFWENFRSSPASSPGEDEEGASRETAITIPDR